MKLFSYKRKVTRPPEKEGDEPTVMWYDDGFNPEYIIRFMTFEDGMIVLLDDGHENTEEEPVRNKRGQIEYQKRRLWKHLPIWQRG